MHGYIGLSKGKTNWMDEEGRGTSGERKGKEGVFHERIICMSSRLGCIGSRVLKEATTAQINIKIYHSYMGELFCTIYLSIGFLVFIYSQNS